MGSTGIRTTPPASYQYILTGAGWAILLSSPEKPPEERVFSVVITPASTASMRASANIPLTTSDFNSLWYDVYVDAYRNALETQKRRKKGLAGSPRDYPGAAGANTRTAASLYGDIPFDDAGKIEVENPGTKISWSYTAKFNPLLDEAIQNLQAGTNQCQRLGYLF